MKFIKLLFSLFFVFLSFSVYATGDTDIYINQVNQLKSQISTMQSGFDDFKAKSNNTQLEHAKSTIDLQYYTINGLVGILTGIGILLAVLGFFSLYIFAKKIDELEKIKDNFDETVKQKRENFELEKMEYYIENKQFDILSQKLKNPLSSNERKFIFQEIKNNGPYKNDKRPKFHTEHLIDISNTFFENQDDLRLLEYIFDKCEDGKYEIFKKLNSNPERHNQIIQKSEKLEKSFIEYICNYYNDIRQRSEVNQLLFLVPNQKFENIETYKEKINKTKFIDIYMDKIKSFEADNSPLYYTLYNFHYLLNDQNKKIFEIKKIISMYES